MDGKNTVMCRRRRAPMALYLEDFTVGQKHLTGEIRVDAEAIKAFAAQAIAPL